MKCSGKNVEYLSTKHTRANNRRSPFATKISREADNLYINYKNKRTYEVVPTIQAIGVTN